MTEITEKGSMEVDSNVKDVSSNDSEKKEEIPDMIYVFTIKISAPNAEPFDIQVSSMEVVQEIHQLLMDREDTSHRTCFSLQFEGNVLGYFVELKNVKNLKDGSVLKVVEEPYTIREARIHVRHVRDLLKSMDNGDAYIGQDCASLSFLSTVCGSSESNEKRRKQESVDCTPPDYLLPNSSERPLCSLQPGVGLKENAKIQCLKILTISGWNPPPGPRKLHGDLMYIFVVTLEDKRFHITSSTRGFYVNQSTEDELNPKPATSPSNLCHSLIELLNVISPAFKKNFSTLQRKRTHRHPFERIGTPYQVYSWTSPGVEHPVDSIRAGDAFSSKLVYEEHIPGQIRDWNDELQTTRELPRKNLPERLLREKAIFRTHSDFVSAASRGAMAVIDGNVLAMNPGDDPKTQVFIWNNIFFCLGFDVQDHYKGLGGDSAAHVAPRNDLQGVKVYNAVDLEGLYTLGTVVVDYRGYRVTAQTIIPGVLEQDQEQSVIYGSINFGKTVVTHSKYMDLLQKAGSQLKILPHTVINEKDEEVGLCSSVECKGIIGNDGRHYILDLIRTFPPDVNFLDIKNLELSREAVALGFPIIHKHKLSCLRQELIDAFVESRYMMFIKFAAVKFKQLGLKKQINVFLNKEEKSSEKESADNNKALENTIDKLEETCLDDNKETESKKRLEDEEAKKIVESITDSITSGDKKDLEESTREIVKKAAEAVGSLKETEFDIRFNPDVFSPGVKHKDESGDFYKKQCSLVKDASEFLLTIQIPAFIRDCLDHTGAPMEGQSLCENLHNRGINLRYLGVISNMLSKVPQLHYIYSISVSEVITRCAKHIFNPYMQSLELSNTAVGVAHFLNCLLSNSSNISANISNEESKKNKRHKKNKNSSRLFDSSEWMSLTPKSLWKSIISEASDYYKFVINVDCIDFILQEFELQKISLLRSFVLKTGIQLKLREYPLEAKSNAIIFTEDDIVNVFPIVKHVNPRATDAYNFYTTGQSKIQQGYLKDGYELITESLNLLNNVYGDMHPEIAQCLRMIARLNYIMGEHGDAMSYQQKAVLMSERVNGIDHPYTITEYVHLSLYCFANAQISTSLKLLYRSRYLILLIFGENHPEVALIDSNIGLILHAVGEYDISLRYLLKGLELNLKYHGPQSLKVAVNYHLVARTQSCMGDFRSALKNEKETFAIYRAQFGDDHDKTKESSECLKHLTTQAVILQKKMNEIYTGQAKANLPPIQIQPPSMGSVLDMLNIINGILFVHVNQQAIEAFKAEFKKVTPQPQQQTTTAPPTSNIPQIPVE